jgi:hypothetical protein
MKTFEEVCVDQIIGLTRCPCCGEGRYQLDVGQDSTFRNEADWAAANFYCGAEFSLGTDGTFLSRIACANPSNLAASQLFDEALDAFDRQPIEREVAI